MNDDFESRTRERLQDSAEHLDAHVRSRLTQARHRALAEVEQRASRPFRAPGFWLPGGAVAAAAVLAITVLLVRPDATPPAAVAGVEDVTSVEDIELLAAADGLDLLAEEAAFYEWAGAPDALAPGASG